MPGEEVSTRTGAKNYGLEKPSGDTPPYTNTDLCCCLGKLLESHTQKVYVLNFNYLKNTTCKQIITVKGYQDEENQNSSVPFKVKLLVMLNDL